MIKATRFLPALVSSLVLAQTPAVIPRANAVTGFHYDPRAEGWLDAASAFSMPDAVRRNATDLRTLDRYYSARFSRDHAEASGRSAILARVRT